MARRKKSIKRTRTKKVKHRTMRKKKGGGWFSFGKDKAKEKMKPALSAEEMEKIYRLADQMDQMQQVDQRESAWTEQDLIDLFGKKTIH